MNLLLRFLFLWLTSYGVRYQLNTVVRQYYRVQPHDMGWRDHLPNFRFLSFMELGRFEFWRGVRGDLKSTIGTRLIAAQDMVYIRPVGFLARLAMDTTLAGWDQKYVYFRHDFYVRGKLVAIGMVKEACVIRGSVVNPCDILGAESPQEANDLLLSWQHFQAEVRNSTVLR